jgi:hypothetical protein
MEIAVGFHSLTTTTHPPNVNLPSSGQQVTARLSARKVSVARWRGLKAPWSGTLHKCMYYRLPEDEPSGSKHVEDIKKLDIKISIYEMCISLVYIV